MPLYTNLLKYIINRAARKELKMNDESGQGAVAPYVRHCMKIVFATERVYGLATGSVRGGSGLHHATEARQVAAYIIREDVLYEDNPVSYPRIGGFLRQDHSTVIHSVKKIRKEIERNSTLRENVLIVRGIVRGEKNSASLPAPKPIPPPKQVLSVVARMFDMTAEQLVQRSNRRVLTVPKQIAQHLLRTVSGRSLNEIAEIFHLQHHTTVLRNLRVIEYEIAANPEIRMLIRIAKEKIR
jgi:chromosomal replication initiation ATPase DnaA